MSTFRMFLGQKLILNSSVLNRHLKYISRHVGQLSEAYVYKVTGDPAAVLHRTPIELSGYVKDGEVLVKMLAAPINPADINMIQGVYPVRPKLPAVGGNEGVGEIVKVGSAVKNLKVRDWVIPSFSGWGTWRTYAICPATDVINIPNDIPLVSAATLSVNPCTAYRLLKDFETLTANDVIIQNGANSGVGQAVIQIASAMNIKTINVVRNRPNLDELVKTLTDLGATHVVTDEYLRTPDMQAMLKNLAKKPKLALNCVGGKSSADLLKCISNEGSMVTYGGMSRQPLMVPAGPLIFSDIRLRGFWMTRWNTVNREKPEMAEMWEFLVALVRNGKLKPPTHRLVNFDQLQDGVVKSMQPMTSEKQILRL